MLQDYLVDKDTGTPLANGIVSLYEDSSRSTYKNWYYQTGSSPNYTWVALDNPLTLSSVGTIQDPNGNDVIPFYYPYDEEDENVRQPYYITVYSADENGEQDVLQFTRENFPYQRSGSSPFSTSSTLRNYILNNVYWRNIGSADLENETDLIIAPSQHDGYTNGDIRFIKDVTGGNDDLIFASMADAGYELENDITPEFYLEMECSNGNGETVKCIQYPISLHVATLAGQPYTLVLPAINIDGAANGYLDLYIYQYTGTGAGSASTLTEIGLGRYQLNNEFTPIVVSDIFPSAESNLGTGGDDAFFLRVQYPLDATFHIGHTKPQIYLSETVPDNDFDTYDQIETIINSPRTGDFRTSLNSFQPYGWLLCNDGVISNSGSITPPSGISVARANADTWPLFNLLWSNTNVAVCPIFDSAGASSTKGASAIADWDADKQIQISLTLGRSFLGLPPAISVTYDRSVTPAWGSVAGTFTATSTSLLYVGAPVYLTGTMPTGGNFVANTVYYAIPAIDGSSTTAFQLASSYANAIAGTAIAAGAASNNGSAIIVNFALGGYFGQSRHVPLEREMFAHTHPGSFIAGSTSTVAGAFVVRSDTGSVNQSVTVASQGNNAPFNVVQPSVYYNVFIKL